jgi:hypothetical protein
MSIVDDPDPVPIRTSPIFATVIEVSSLVDVVPVHFLEAIERRIAALDAGVRGEDVGLDPEVDGFNILGCRIARFPTLRYLLYSSRSTTHPDVEIFLFPEDYAQDIGNGRCRIHLVAGDSRMIIGSNIFQNTVGIFSFHRIGFCDPM